VDFAQCAISSLTTEAARQSIPVDELIARLRAAVSSGDLNVSDMSMYDVTVAVSGVIDLSSMETSLLPCWADAAQRAGIPFESGVEAMTDQLDQERR
jgi:hypothetical protein